MVRIPRYLEYIFVCVALWFVIGNPINLLMNGVSGGQVEEDIRYRNSSFLLPALSMGLYFIALTFSTFRWKLLLSRLRSNPQFIFLIGFLLLVFLSSLWSVYPNVTTRRGILLIGTTGLTLFFSLGFTFKQQIRLLIIVFCVNVIISLVFGLLLSDYGVMKLPPHTGAWRGVYLHKNKLGAQMALTTGFLLFSQYTNLFSSKALWIVRLFTGLSFSLVIAANSTTGLVATIALVFTSIACNAFKLSYRSMVVAVAAIILGVASFVVVIQTNADSIFGLFGKGSDLTGRDDIWSSLWYLINQKPLLGYGYAGFWGPAGSPADLVRQQVGWNVPHAHNGFIEVLLALGWIGGGLFFSNFFITVVKSLQMARTTKKTYAVFPILVLVFLVLSNLTESNLFTFDSWVFYVWTSLSPSQVLSAHLEEQIQEESEVKLALSS